MVKLTAPAGKKLRDTRTGTTHTEVITEERKARFFVVADSEADPIMQILDGSSTISDKVAALEDELSAAKILLGVE